MSNSSGKSRRIYFQGMHCASCEMLISQELKKITGVGKVKISYLKQIAEVFYQGQEPTFDQSFEIIKKLGYQPSFEPVPLKSKKQLRQWFYSLLIVLILYLIYRWLDLPSLLGGLNINTDNLSYSVAFLIGLAASVSTCLAVVGSVVISFAAKYQTAGDFYQSNVKPHLLFHLGRLLTFFLLGGALGMVGGWFSFSTKFISWFTIMVAIVLLWLGLNILGLAPSLSKLGIRLPKKTFVFWQRLDQSDHRLVPVLLGGLTFFLPCGFTQSMQLFALASGSFITGGLSLFFFALGTAPVLIGLGVATTRFKNFKAGLFKKAAGIIVILFAIYTFFSGLAASGLNLDFTVSKKSTMTIADSDFQVIEMSVDYSGFKPDTLVVRKDLPVRWIINGSQLSGCTNRIIVPSLDINQSIKAGENTIEFTPTKAGTINFSCWMGMVRGKFIVVDPLS